MGEGKTPETWDAWAEAMRAKHGNGNGHGKSLAIEAQRLLPTPRATRGGSATETVELLPTPRAMDMKGGYASETAARRTADGKATISEAVVTLLSTPTAGLGEGGGQRSHRWSDGSQRTHNPVELAHDIADGTMTDFGPYTAAIARWGAVLGRPAPSPTEPGKDGRPRLSPRFVEWMQGLPDGWVTDTGIPRNAQLKALGNGVVPQQAALALSILLPRLEES